MDLHLSKENDNLMAKFRTQIKPIFSLLRRSWKCKKPPKSKTKTKSNDDGLHCERNTWEAIPWVQELGNVVSVRRLHRIKIKGENHIDSKIGSSWKLNKQNHWWRDSMKWTLVDGILADFIPPDL